MTENRLDNLKKVMTGERANGKNQKLNRPEKPVTMNLEFRELKLDDLPAIKELSDSMGMLNDPKIGDIAEAILRDPKNYFYGAFKEKKLVGVGRLRGKSKNLAWIESIRVHGRYQRKGIGTKLFRYGEKIARERNYRIVGYQTVTENKGSCRIGEILGFQRKHEMTAFYLNPNEFPKIDDKYIKQTPVPIEEALNLLEQIPNGPKEEICTGWSYAPIEFEFFKSEPDMDFFFSEGTVLLEYRDRDFNTNEIAFVKAILYGSNKNVQELLSDFIRRNAERNLWLVCLCPDHLIPSVLKMGFQYAKVWTGNKNVVVLFTKELA
ncbi:MAG: GNAT family N-acetyltransferase [Candidatus Hermodarchaeota archaeon]